MQTLILVLIGVLVAGIVACLFYLRYAIKLLRNDIYSFYSEFGEFRYSLFRFFNGEETPKNTKRNSNK